MDIELGPESLEVLLAFQKFERSELFTIAYDAVEAMKRSLVTSWSVAESNLHALTKAEKLLDHRLGTYTDTFITTFKTQFEQMVYDQSARHQGLEHFVYEGPDDSKTRPQCQDGLTIKYFTEAEKNEFNAEGIRYNCRHIFVPITEEEYEKGIS